MANKFKNIFLVCLDFGDDLNHVVARNPSLKKARFSAEEAKKRWPDNEVYITVEKVLEQNLDDEEMLPSPSGNSNNSQKCICGREKGGCVSNLSCKCSAIAKCKQMNIHLDPFTTPDKQELEPTELQIVNIRRGIIEIVIPDWDPEETIGLSPNEIPKDIMPYLEKGVVLEADINLEAGSAEDITIQNLRLVYEDDEEDEDDNEEYIQEESELPFYNFMGPQLTGRSNPTEIEEETYPELPDGEDELDDELDDDEFDDEFEENASFEE
jgi:hypothetical protein